MMYFLIGVMIRLFVKIMTTNKISFIYIMVHNTIKYRNGGKNYTKKIRNINCNPAMKNKLKSYIKNYQWE